MSAPRLQAYEQQIHPRHSATPSAAARLNWFFTRVPNGGKHWRIEAATFKSLGVRSGHSDLLLWQGRSHALELKVREADAGPLVRQTGRNQGSATPAPENPGARCHD